MKTLPVRFWLWLLIIAVVAMPSLTTIGLVIWRDPPPGDVIAEFELDPALRAEITEHADRWGNTIWQASLTPRLAEEGWQVLLVDASGDVVYRSAGWPESDRVSGASQVVTLPAASDDGAVALLRQVDGPVRRPEPPWFSSELWRIPLAQMIALLAIAGAIALFVHHAFLRPLSRMVEAMRQVGAGDLDVRLPRSRVTEVDEVAKAFDGMADALRTALERQEALEQERRMTISAVVHDLRTPLFSLRGYLEGLATGLADTPEKAARYVRVCREKADALERLVSDLFAYTRTEYLEEVPQPETLDLGELLRRTVEGLQPQAEAKGVRLWFDDGDGMSLVAGDSLLLMRAVENILDNAVRHTPADGEIRVSWQRLADRIAFSVTDSGPGIPLADLPHLFTPLFRGESSRNRRTGGAGLGLTIARRLLRAHGGDLVAANVPHGGAVFTGMLPTSSHANETDAGGAAIAARPGRRPPDAEATPARVPNGKF